MVIFTPPTAALLCEERVPAKHLVGYLGCNDVSENNVFSPPARNQNFPSPITVLTELIRLGLNPFLSFASGTCLSYRPCTEHKLELKVNQN